MHSEKPVLSFEHRVAAKIERFMLCSAYSHIKQGLGYFMSVYKYIYCSLVYFRSLLRICFQFIDCILRNLFCDLCTQLQPKLNSSCFVSHIVILNKQELGYSNL